MRPRAVLPAPLLRARAVPPAPGALFRGRGYLAGFFVLDVCVFVVGGESPLCKGGLRVASRVARSVRSLAKRSRAEPSASLYSAMALVPSSFCCSRQSFTSSGLFAMCYLVMSRGARATAESHSAVLLVAESHAIT